MTIEGHTHLKIYLFGLLDNNYAKFGGFVRFQYENDRINVKLHCHCGSALILQVLLPTTLAAAVI